MASAVDSAAAAPAEKNHIFQVLQYLKKVCNHPAFVLTPEHPWHASVTKQLKREGSSLADIKHSAKIAALRQLLLDCGIGTADVGRVAGAKSEAAGTADAIENVVGQHRCLVFAQSKRMLDVIARDLLRAHLPSVTYLRLDGSVPPAKRHAVVDAFNGDPSVDLLLLTTSVGGLGLTLTGADTVIFMEHDWNPSKDLQAMDRAHRIGQKKVRPPTPPPLVVVSTHGHTPASCLRVQRHRTRVDSVSYLCISPCRTLANGACCCAMRRWSTSTGSSPRAR